MRATSAVFRYSLCILVLSGLFASPVYAACTAQQTASYLTEGTSYVLTPKSVDYVIVIDKSGSMEGTKLEKVKQAAKSLVDQLPPNERAAIISFNYDATLDHALSNDHTALAKSIDSMKAGFGTQYAPPFTVAAQQLAFAQKDKAFIFLSDGKSDFAESFDQIIALTEGIATSGACILTVSYALGGEESELLRTMADVGKSHGCGDHFIASEKGNELETVFSTIHDTLSATELLDVHPVFANASYSLTFTSKLNGKPAPGSSDVGCVDEPAVALTLTRNGRPAAALTEPAGAYQLGRGAYTYKATASLHCDGACSYSGLSEGSFSVTGVCDPQYVDLASYVTGDTQTVSITNIGFEPSAVSGRIGTVVLWRNDDTVAHHVASARFDEVVQPGGTFRYVLENVGTLIYSDPERDTSGSLTPVKGTGTDVLLVMDESGSMKGQGIDEARAAAKTFFNLLSPVDRGALLTFSQQANLLQDFTSDKDALGAAAERITAKGPTNYLTALNLVPNLHRTQHGVLVFMSDGTPTDPEGEGAILKQTEMLRKQGWCVMTVGFGEEGAAARNLLASMAGTDECSAFLYASAGSLTEAFGTIYQLASKQTDLMFTDLDVPKFSFSKSVTLKTGIKTKTGRPVPGGEDECSPAAVVQAHSGEAAATLAYADGAYSATFPVTKFSQDIQLIAVVAAQDQPGLAFVGTETVRVYRIPPFELLAALLFFVAIIVIYLVRRRSEV